MTIAQSLKGYPMKHEGPFVNSDEVKKKAQEEIDEERFRNAVETMKQKLRDKKSFLDLVLEKQRCH